MKILKEDNAWYNHNTQSMDISNYNLMNIMQKAFEEGNVRKGNIIYNILKRMEEEK